MAALNNMFSRRSHLEIIASLVSVFFFFGQHFFSCCFGYIKNYQRENFAKVYKINRCQTVSLTPCFLNFAFVMATVDICTNACINFVHVYIYFVHVWIYTHVQTHV